MLQKIGLIGDVHAQAALLETALNYLQTASVDAILCTGDIANGPHLTP